MGLMHRREVLVIDDDPEMRKLLRTTLSVEYRFREATSVTEGVAESRRRPPDVVLLDPKLPDGDGLEVIRQIREWHLTLPIIVLSERTHEQDKIETLDGGADDYLTKPFGVGELMARIRVALRRTTNPRTQSAPGVFRFG